MHCILTKKLLRSPQNNNDVDIVHLHTNPRSLFAKPITLTKNQKLALITCILILFSVLLSGCSLFSFKKAEVKDGAPKNPKSVAHIPNATPKDEPKSKYGNMPSYEVMGKKYKVMDSSHGYKAKGVASWYGTKFHGRKTSSGEPYDLYGMTAAHKSLPLPTYVKVKNLKNGKEVVVKVNDRGPFVDNRLIDLSYAAAKKLGVYETGTAPVQIVAINPKGWGKAKAPIADLNQPTTDKFLYLQLGAFQDLENAQRLAAQAMPIAQQNHLDVKIHETSNTGKSLHKVRLGPILNANLLSKLQKQILASNLPSPTILTE